MALDGFGTGCSALSDLPRFPFDTILAMARALDMATVAEGVEQEVEAQMLRQRGCTTLQGDFFGQPIPSEAVPGFLARGRRSRDVPSGVSTAPDLTR